MMIVVWKNGVDKEDIKAAKRIWSELREDLKVLYKPYDVSEREINEFIKQYGIDPESVEDIYETLNDIKCDYGLSIDKHPEYVSYVFATGGPHYEIRFFKDGHKEFVYLDWFKGVGFDITGDEVIQSVYEELRNLGIFEDEY